MRAAGKFRVAVENADVVESEKSAFKNIIAFGVFAVYPPRKIKQKFVKNPFEKIVVGFARALGFNLVNA